MQKIKIAENLKVVTYIYAQVYLDNIKNNLRNINATRLNLYKTR